MSETAHFTYEGHAKLLGSLPPAASSPIQILHIDHLIPISVKCLIGGDEKTVTAYIDYSTNTVHLPQDTLDLLGSGEEFKNALLDYLAQQSDRFTREHDEQYRTQYAEQDIAQGIRIPER